MVKHDLGERVAEAAVQALKHEKYVSAVNVLIPELCAPAAAS
jgi:hypothetical protein